MKKSSALQFLFRLEVMCLVLGLLPKGDAQQPISSPTTTPRDQSAIQFVAQALNVMAGSAAWSAVSDATLTGGCQSADAETVGSQQPAPFRWINAASEFRYENGDSNDFNVMLSGHGKPSMVLPNETRSLTYETAAIQKPFHLPGLVLQQILNDQSYWVELIGPESLSGEGVTHLRFTHSFSNAKLHGSRQDWWLDSATFIPIKVSFLVPGQGVDSYMAVTYTFSSWAPDAGGLSIPHQILITNEFGVQSQSCLVSQLTLNTQPAASLFDAR